MYWRNRLGLTAKQVGEMVGVSDVTVLRWEKRGPNQNYGYATTKRRLHSKVRRLFVVFESRFIFSEMSQIPPGIFSHFQPSFSVLLPALPIQKAALSS